MKVIQIFKNFWNTGGGPPERLDLFRIFFALGNLLLVSKIVPWFTSEIPNCMWQPPGLAQVLMPTPISESQLFLIGTLFKIALILVILGLFSRISALVCGICLIFLLGASHSAFFYNTSGNSLPLVFFILAATPALGSRYSLENLLRKSGFAINEVDCIWPQRLVKFLFFFCFFAAGLSKILAFNNWTDAENILAIFKWSREIYGPAAPDLLRDELHAFLLSSPSLAHVIGVATIVLEISSAFFFFSKKYQSVGVILIALFHVAIFFVMYFTYILILPLYLIFVPWEKLLKK